MEGSPPSSDYWGTYYGKQEAPVLPSQFALFVANEIATGEIPPVGTICDIGCGNGRDALFFLQLGYQVQGLDASDAAITVCRERLATSGATMAARGRFHSGAADAGESWQRLGETLSGPVLVYARFFFHAIDDAAELAVLAHAAALIGRSGGAFCAEFRTPEDRDAAKVTPAHYRRFIDLDQFAGRVAAAGLKPVWQAEGRGMAKYRADDAHVARLVAIA
jgi:SAM-dependent methyltransferase